VFAEGGCAWLEAAGGGRRRLLLHWLCSVDASLKRMHIFLPFACEALDQATRRLPVHPSTSEINIFYL
jgi:hypothetical protein